MTDVDVPAAHRRFAVECFNGAWDLLEKAARSPDETSEMIHMAHASLWHWIQSGQIDAQKRAVGTWQLARVYAAAGIPDEARRYGEESLDLSRGNELAPFYLAYAHESLARAAAVAGNDTERDHQLEAAAGLAGRIENEENRRALLDDLATI